MPVSVATTRDPFREEILPGGGRRRLHTDALRLPQARVLQALMPPYPEDPPSEWPILNRPQLGLRAGFTALSGSCTRALNGIARADSKMGSQHPGLLALGYVEEVLVDLDGVTEVNYRATPAGVAAFRAYIDAGGEVPPMKDPSLCINDRYRKEP